MRDLFLLFIEFEVRCLAFCWIGCSYFSKFANDTLLSFFWKSTV